MFAYFIWSIREILSFSTKLHSRGGEVFSRVFQNFIDLNHPFATHTKCFAPHPHPPTRCYNTRNSFASHLIVQNSNISIWITYPDIDQDRHVGSRYCSKTPSHDCVQLRFGEFVHVRCNYHHRLSLKSYRFRCIYFNVMIMKMSTLFLYE